MITALAMFITIASITPLYSQDSATSPSRGTLLAPKAFRAAAAKVQPSLVRIEGFGGIAAGVDGGGYQAPGEGPTTGVALSSDGYIITSTFNFLRKPPIVTVVTPDGRRHVAKLLGRDETRKICLLKVDGVNLSPPTFAERDQLKVGQWVVAMGIGFGDPQPALSAGMISATNRVSGKAVQTDANLSPANYGGPLIDLEGRVVGICVPLSPQSQEESAGAEWYDSGIGFAIPLSGLDTVIGAMKESKTLRAGFLGVQAEPYGQPPTGAAVKEVLPDSPAAKAGFTAGDKLLAVGDTPILDVAHLQVVIGRYLEGDKVTVSVQRGEERLMLEAVLAAAPPKAKPMPATAPMPGAPDQPPMPRP